MKKYSIQSIFIVSVTSAIAVTKSPTFANDTQANIQVSQILLSQQDSEVETTINNYD